MDKVIQEMQERRDAILQAFAEKQVKPTPALTRELAELEIAIENGGPIAPPKPVLIARLTVSRKDGKRTIVEIHADATFHHFYHFFTQDGARRSTKTLLRTANRNAYLPTVNAHLHKPGLDVIERQLKTLLATTNPVLSTKLRVIRKRLYRKLITAAPDALGLSKINKTFIDHVHRPRPVARIPIRIGKAIPAAKFIWPASLKLEGADHANV